MKSNKTARKLLYLVTALAVVCILFFAYYLFAYIQRTAHTAEIQRQSEIISEISRLYQDVVQTARDLLNNDEIVAHIYIPGTSINYAVVHGVDNEFYLYHDVLRKPNSNGSIFLDYLNSPCFTDISTILYGHNMENGTMFHDLGLFKEKEFFEENESIFVTTLYETLHYEIFAVFTTHVNFNYIIVDFADYYEFLNLVYEMKDRAAHLRDVTITENDKILILSTCTAIGRTGRIVVVGRLKF